jgi:hypothetical protein
VALRIAALGRRRGWIYTTTYKHMLRILKAPGSIPSMETRLSGSTNGRLLLHFSGWYVRWEIRFMLRDGVFTEVLIKTEVQWSMLQRTMLQRKVFIIKIRMLQRTQMLQRKILCAFNMESSITVFTRENLFMLFKFKCTKVK